MVFLRMLRYPFPTHWTMEWDRMDDYLAEFARMKEKYASEIELAIGAGDRLPE